MDTNDTIADLLKDIPKTASVLLALNKISGGYVLIFENFGAYRITALSIAQGEALALVYPADVNTLNCVDVAVMQAELRKRTIDLILTDLV